MDNIFKILNKLVHHNASQVAASTFNPIQINSIEEAEVAFHPYDFCGKSSKNDPIVISTRFYVAGVSVAVISGLGILSNVISLVTLSSMSRRGLFIKLLLALTTFDLVFLISGGLFMLQQAFNFSNTVYNVLFPKLIYPLAGFSMTGNY